MVSQTKSRKIPTRKISPLLYVGRYYHKKTKCALVRCAQPMVGATGRRSESDEFLIRAVRNASPNPAQLVIFDARSGTTPPA